MSYRWRGRPTPWRTAWRATNPAASSSRRRWSVLVRLIPRRAASASGPAAPPSRRARRIARPVGVVGRVAVAMAVGVAVGAGAWPVGRVAGLAAGAARRVALGSLTGRRLASVAFSRRRRPARARRRRASSKSPGPRARARRSTYGGASTDRVVGRVGDVAAGAQVDDRPQLVEDGHVLEGVQVDPGRVRLVEAGGVERRSPSGRGAGRRSRDRPSHHVRHAHARRGPAPRRSRRSRWPSAWASGA